MSSKGKDRRGKRKDRREREENNENGLVENNENDENNGQEYEYVERDMMDQIMKGNHIYEDIDKGKNHYNVEDQVEDELKCPGVEGLFDKSYAKRMESLNQWILALRQNYIPNKLMEFHETIMDAIRRALKRGEDELMTGCTLLMVACVTLGDQSSNSFAPFFEIFKSIITRGKNNEEIAYCIETLGLICFIWGDRENSLSCCDLFINMLLRYPNNIIIANACQRQLSLIYSTFPDEDIINFIESDPAFEKITNLIILSNDSRIKMDVGESLAFFASVVKRELNDSYDVSYFESFIDIESVLTNLTTQKKSNSRFELREILKTIQEGIVPEVQLTIRNQKFIIDSWNHHLQMNAIRNTLATGFLNHLENNFLLSEIFDIDVPQEFIILNKNEKRQLHSKQSMVSYLRTNDRNRNRGNKTKSVTNFLNDV